MMSLCRLSKSSVDCHGPRQINHRGYRTIQDLEDSSLIRRSRQSCPYLDAQGILWVGFILAQATTGASGGFKFWRNTKLQEDVLTLAYEIAQRFGQLLDGWVNFWTSPVERARNDIQPELRNSFKRFHPLNVPGFVKDVAVAKDSAIRQNFMDQRYVWSRSCIADFLWWIKHLDVDKPPSIEISETLTTKTRYRQSLPRLATGQQVPSQRILIHYEIEKKSAYRQGEKTDKISYWGFTARSGIGASDPPLSRQICEIVINGEMLIL